MLKPAVRTILIAALVAVGATAAARPAHSSEPETPDPYLRLLIERASDGKLFDRRYWHLLLHYRKNLLGGYTSEADGAGFFMAPDGRSNPRRELEATLEKFFSDELVGTSKQQAQCAFPARYRWLKEELNFDPDRLPERKCERFETWKRGIDPQSVSLIFPASYMNNPSSMFGHTLLRIDQKGQTEQTRLLAYVINYAAEVTTENGLAYAVWGISGMFKGYFSIMPYYLKVREYSDMENRDIWEYLLNFDSGAIERLLMHAWELGNTYFDYFFFKENCSYHLLSLLEVADPDLHLTDHFYLWTIPADTVRLVTEQPGLVTGKNYRPSRSTQIRRKREMLNRREDRWLLKLIGDPGVVRSMGFDDLSIDRRAFLLDTSYDYVRYRSVGDDRNLDRYRSMEQSLLASRSLLGVPSETPAIAPFTDAPEKGHRVQRLGIGGGWRGHETFEDLSLRLAYHDLLDPQTGYTPDSQIEILNIRLRHDNRANKTRMDELVLASIVSLTPIDALFRHPSWKLSAGWKTIPVGGCEACRVLGLNGGAGGAVRGNFLGEETFYAFAEAEAESGPSLEDRFRAGGGGTAGVLISPVNAWRIHLSAGYLSFPIGDRSRQMKRSAEQGFTLMKDLALRMGLERMERQTRGWLRLEFFI